MPSTRDDLFRFLRRLNIETATVEHPPLYTVEESKRLRGDLEGAHTKNLFLKSKKGELFLLTALESTEIALSHLHKRLGCARLSFGSPELLQEVLGVQPGSVTALALMNDTAHRVTFVLDDALLRYGILNVHPLVNTATTAIMKADFLRFLKATGHEPRILSFGDEIAVESVVHP